MSSNRSPTIPNRCCSASAVEGRPVETGSVGRCAGPRRRLAPHRDPRDVVTEPAAEGPEGRAAARGPRVLPRQSGRDAQARPHLRGARLRGTAGDLGHKGRVPRHPAA
ncbi:hypothetical protein GCM10023405_39260 [Streptomonospora salina]